MIAVGTDKIGGIFVGADGIDKALVGEDTVYSSEKYIDTGLGWKAKAKYLRYDADTDLGTWNKRTHQKPYTGWALIVGVISSDTAAGPIAISTNTSAANLKYADQYVYTPNHTFQYLGLTWYYNSQNRRMDIDTSYDNRDNLIVLTGEPSAEAMFTKIVTEAGVILL